jgi:restriction endonuclease S subunit
VSHSYWHRGGGQAGDILVARIGATTGKTFLVDYAPDAVFASYLIRLRSKPKVTAAFLSAFTETELYWRQIDAAKGGRLKHGVNIPVLQHLLVPKPDLAEQQQIASRLSIVQAKLAAEEKRRLALDNLFQSLLHNLMTGCVRVNHLFDELVGADPRVGPVGGAHGGAPLRGGNRGTGTR